MPGRLRSLSRRSQWRRRKDRPTSLIAGLVLLLASALIDARQVPASSALRNPNATTAGELVVEPPTLINLGFEWFIQGDANRNAAVQVSFRRQGTAGWTPALPLLRLGGERVYAESRVDVVAPDMFAGSVLDLQPDTAYEVRLALSDPDGTQGVADRTLLVRTRAEPRPY